ncbi:hypothetical protein JX265_008942 [Neoarthrinium moseri]|uniref:Uncharacterized protein n=1 Tax=Neoarthrinium moseri TaxID=1658444 RepID=A0A9Q0ALY8_9PEZI|nr:uncharacterized protein JN550_007812 [Neoarthrinium moseri]KAI1862896.1 hypothetical protein JX265_008942 [Neoarthrinium moseri]KAI1866123.1 hypothetical protein JN550_007812 [Neoarthrinium moseri]
MSNPWDEALKAGVEEAQRRAKEQNDNKNSKMPGTPSNNVDATTICSDVPSEAPALNEQKNPTYTQDQDKGSSAK